MAGIVDEPLAIKDGNDTLGVEKYSRALSDFIISTDTPMTIGVQGEWGSGKTSILNQVWNKLEKQGDALLIWVNTWEYSLLSQPEEALLKIIFAITDKIGGSDKKKDNTVKLKKAAGSLMKGALRVGTTMALGSKAGTVVDEMLVSGDSSVSEIRNALTDIVKDISASSSNPYKKIIVFVDDLDRLDPSYAVTILELLKNIFNIPQCVFVLAIDYQVVVKGLKEKFGELSTENEWEFRAFFDKIIQLPFMMPMSNYSIGQYVQDLLNKISFEIAADDVQFIEEVVLLSIGGNPRSIKRLVNSLSLINYFSAEEMKDKNLRMILFAVTCIQVAYPKIYEVLSRHSDFTNWNSDISFEFTKGRENDDDSFDSLLAIASKTDDFDEEWEQALYRICFIIPFLNQRVLNISRLMSVVREYLKQKKMDVEKSMSLVLQQTSITSVVSTDTSSTNMKPWKSDDDKQLTKDYWSLFLVRTEEKYNKYYQWKNTSSDVKIFTKKFALPFNSKISTSIIVNMNKKSVAAGFFTWGEKELTHEELQEIKKATDLLREKLEEVSEGAFEVDNKNDTNTVIRYQLSAYDKKNWEECLEFQLKYVGVISDFFINYKTDS